MCILLNLLLVNIFLLLVNIFLSFLSTSFSFLSTSFSRERAHTCPFLFLSWYLPLTYVCDAQSSDPPSLSVTCRSHAYYLQVRHTQIQSLRAKSTLGLLLSWYEKSMYTHAQKTTCVLLYSFMYTHTLIHTHTSLSHTHTSMCIICILNSNRRKVSSSKL